MSESFLNLVRKACSLLQFLKSVQSQNKVGMDSSSNKKIFACQLSAFLVVESGRNGDTGQSCAADTCSFQKVSTKGISVCGRSWLNNVYSTNSDPHKLSTSRSTCQSKWVRIGVIANAASINRGNLDSLSYDQSPDPSTSSLDSQVFPSLCASLPFMQWDSSSPCMSLHYVFACDRWALSRIISCCTNCMQLQLTHLGKTQMVV